MTLVSGVRRPLIVAEPEHEGHRMVYFAAVAEHLLARGTPVSLATSRTGFDSSDLALRVPDVAQRVRHIDIGEPPTRDGEVATRLVRIVAALQARHPDSDVLVTEGDKFLPAALASPARIDWRRMRVLVMRMPRRSRRPRALAQDSVKAAAIELALRRGADVRVLEQATPVRAAYRHGRWRTVPDPVDVATGAPTPPELAGLSRDRRWVGVVGHVSPRKNLDMVIEAARLAGAREVGVLVAGRVKEGEWERCAPAVERFEQAGGRIVALDRLLSDADLDACVAWVDAVVVAHSSEGPSGILGKAVALGTPVVAAGALSLRDEVARLDGGTWAQLRAADIAAAIWTATGPTGSSGGRAPGPVALAGSADFAHALLED